MATSNPLRLDRELVSSAAEAAQRQKRSVPRQIEYWAELGRSVERLIDLETLAAVEQGLARLVVEMAPSEPVASDEVFADLASARREGALRVAEGRVRYQASQRPGLLEQVQPDGKRIVGRFSLGQFVPVDD